MADVINTLFVLIKKDAIESSSTSISIDQIFDKSYSRCNDVASTRNSIGSSMRLMRSEFCDNEFLIPSNKSGNFRLIDQQGYFEKVYYIL